MIGSRVPIRPIPIAWIIVVTPTARKFALTSRLVSAASRPMAEARISGTAMVPGIMTSRCWKPITSVRPSGRRVSNIEVSPSGGAVTVVMGAA